ncbi:MAG: hypothetical protein HOI66_03140 [Verrucomicrobia bacterium]|nr:hypothetical protein [Verrucomicrobiota bacterium]
MLSVENDAQITIMVDCHSSPDVVCSGHSLVNLDRRLPSLGGKTEAKNSGEQRYCKPRVARTSEVKVNLEESIVQFASDRCPLSSAARKVDWCR